MGVRGSVAAIRRKECFRKNSMRRFFRHEDVSFRSFEEKRIGKRLPGKKRPRVFTGKGGCTSGKVPEVQDGVSHRIRPAFPLPPCLGEGADHDHMGRVSRVAIHRGGDSPRRPRPREASSLPLRRLAQMLEFRQSERLTLGLWGRST
jgi:hypothetical protein